MINLRYFCFVVIQLYLKVRALALFYFINLHHYTYITNRHTKIHRDSSIHSNPDVSKSSIHRNYSFIPDPDVFMLISRDSTRFSSKCIPAQADFNKNIHRNDQKSSHPDVFILISRECTCFPPQNTPAQAGINPAGYIGICYSRGAPMYLLQITTHPPNVLPLTQSASCTSPHTA